MKKLFFIIPAMLICLVIINLSAEAKQKQDKDFNIIIAVNHLDYEEVCNVVKEAGGTVRFQYKYCEAVAVTMPSDNLESILNMPEVQGSYKDREFSLPKSPVINRPGFETVYDHIQNTADHVQATTTAELEGLIGSGPNNYQPFTSDLTGANDFWSNTGHYGEEVIVGIMDTGVSSAAVAVAPRIVGAENFTGDEIPGDSSLNHPHGTQVACCVGANAIFGFGDPTIQNAVKAYCPSCVIPNHFAPGIDGIPMLGQAPAALFYSFKVFDTNLTTSVSILLAAMERAIELKKENILPNLKVINMSFGGPSLFSGEDPFFAQLVEMMDDVGILVTVSAGNAGASGMTISDPGLAENILTVGASDDATHERIVMEIVFGFYPGVGLLWRPIDNNQTAYFSSRGPTADGRIDPEIVAPGTWRFVQHANGDSISWASGTSFSAPTVAGAAALLLSAHPESQPNDLRGALLNGANPTLLTDNSGEQDQGFGFLDVVAANTELIEGAKNPKDKGKDKKEVEQNIKKVADIKVIKKKDFTENTSDLLPGQRAEYFYEIKKDVNQVTVTISDVTPELPQGAQNQLFGDDLFVFIHSAKTSAIGDDGDYRAGTPAFVGEDATFVLEGSDLDEGIARITILGNWTNAGKISATIHISREDGKQDHYFSKKGKVAEGELKEFSIDVQSNTEELNLKLNWKGDWGHYPTNDLDMYVYDPNGDGNWDGCSLDSPERIKIDNPEAGTWSVSIYGFKVWEKEEKFELFVKGLSKSLFEK
ncbi:MAG: S8 family serine peptidase [Deltaproteobacteria bacterium]|jgi:subtilisin family serine protease|nr:S8 family serine peptidase [Deltaproteobacteria bacterium]